MHSRGSQSPLVIVLLIASMLLLGVPAVTHAADGPPPGVDPNRQIVVNPGFVQRSAAPGDRLTVNVRVQNQTQAVYDFSAVRQDLVAATDGCADQRRLAPGTSPQGSGNWIVPSPSSFSIAGEHERSVRISITVPSNVSPGSYAASLELQAQGRGQGNIALRAEIGIPIIIDVTGVSRSQLTTTMHIRGGKWRWSAQPVYADIVVKNSGIFAENIGGEAILDGWFGRSNARLPAALLLPGASCAKRIRIDVRNAPDRLQASFRLVHARAGESGAQPATRITNQMTLVVIPWWVVLLIVVGALTITARIRYRRRHNRRADIEDDSDW